MVEPILLEDKHLIAELHELPRIPNGILKGRLSVDRDRRPDMYVVGKGHMLFFTNKLFFLCRRYKSLMQEYTYRFHRSWQFPFPLQMNQFPDLWHSFHPTYEAVSLSLHRLREKLPVEPRLYRRSITPELWSLRCKLYYGLLSPFLHPVLHIDDLFRYPWSISDKGILLHDSTVSSPVFLSSCSPVVRTCMELAARSKSTHVDLCKLKDVASLWLSLHLLYPDKEKIL